MPRLAIDLSMLYGKYAFFERFAAIQPDIAELNRRLLAGRERRSVRAMAKVCNISPIKPHRSDGRGYCVFGTFTPKLDAPKELSAC